MLRPRKQLSCLDTAGTGIQNEKCDNNASPKEWIEAFAIIIPVFAILIGWAFYQQRQQAKLDQAEEEKRGAGEEV